MPSHFWFNVLWVGWAAGLHTETIMNNTTPNLTITPTPTLNWHNQIPKSTAGRILIMVTKWLSSSVCESKCNHLWQSEHLWQHNQNTKLTAGRILIMVIELVAQSVRVNLWQWEHLWQQHMENLPSIKHY